VAAGVGVHDRAGGSESEDAGGRQRSGGRSSGRRRGERGEADEAAQVADRRGGGRLCGGSASRHGRRRRSYRRRGTGIVARAAPETQAHLSREGGGAGGYRRRCYLVTTMVEGSLCGGRQRQHSTEISSFLLLPLLSHKLYSRIRLAPTCALASNLQKNKRTTVYCHLYSFFVPYHDITPSEGDTAKKMLNST